MLAAEWIARTRRERRDGKAIKAIAQDLWLSCNNVWSSSGLRTRVGQQIGRIGGHSTYAMPLSL